MVRLPRFGRERVRVEPSAPHRFREINDPGLGAFAVGAGATEAGLSSVVSVGVADNYLRKSRCGVPGCGKPRHDPIHEVEE